MNDQWRTPPYIFEWASWLVGGIEKDTACNIHNALAPPVADKFGDALKCSWRGRVWCNPPYSEIDPWVNHALGQDATTAMLIPSPNGEARYERLMEWCYEISIIGRVGFLDEDGNEIKGNRAGSSLFVINGKFSDGDRKGQRGFIHRERIRIKQWGNKP